MTSVPNFAPGCFGSALAYQDDHPICSSCKFSVECRPIHLASLEALRAECNIADKKLRFKMNEPTKENPTPGAKVLTKKLQAYADRLDSAGINVTGSFARGENPFKADCMKFLFIAAHVLLKLDRPLRQEVLAQAYMGKLKVGQETANAYARNALQLFRHVGAVDELDGGFSLRRNNGE